MCQTAAMDTTITKMLPSLWKSTLVSGVLALILGALILAWPGRTILVAAVLFGVYLVVTGIAQLILAFSMPVMSSGGRVMLFLSGTASVILAVLCFRHFNSDQEAVAVLLLAIWIAIGFIFRGVALTVAGISDPGMPGRGWQLFMGVVSLLAGLVMLAAPFSSLWVLALVAGWWLVIIGVIEIIAAIKVRSQASKA